MKDIYKTYSPETLAADPDFIDWIQKKSSIDIQLWDEWIKNNPDSQSLIKEATSIVQGITFEKFDTQGAADRIWARIEKSTSDKILTVQKKKVIMKPIRFLMGAIAAGIAVLLYFQFFMGSDLTINTFAGQDQMHTLPDASTIHLNDASTLSYHEKSYANDRVIQLNGEAFFEVNKGAPFVVATKQGTIEVLGTSFNVFSRESGFQVKCYTGKVLVKSQQSTVTLLPGQMFSTISEMADDHLEVFDPKNYQDWRQGFFSYRDASLSEVIREIERQFEVNISLAPGLDTMKYTGFFMESDLQEALHSICWPLNLESHVNNKKVKINSNF